MRYYRGPRSSNHIDLLGHRDWVTDILKIAAGAADDMPDNVLSDIDGISERINLKFD